MMNCVPAVARKCVVTLALLLGMAVCGSAQQTCSNQNLSGAFGFTVAGTNVEFNVQFAIHGRFVADGQGAFIGTANQSAGGQVILQFPFTGKYSVRPDCSGSALFSFPNGSIANLEFVLVDDGKEVMILSADQGTVEFGTAKKQFLKPPSQGMDKDKS